jgi:peptidoglycan/LPS O-acetylase OafA/YrhL
MTFSKRAVGVDVSFFFILSGFVLTWSVRPGDTYGRMLRRRLVRIFPHHVLTFALAMVVSAAAVTPPGVAALNLLLLQAWSPDWSVYMSVNYPSWSLSCELFFYALFPVLLPLLGRIDASRLWWWAGVAAGTVMVLPLAANLLPVGQTFPAVGSFLDGESTNRMWFVYVFPAARLVEFVLGILAARIVISGRWIGLRPGISGVLAVIACVIAAYTPQMFTAAAVTVVPLALLVATGVRTPLGVVVKCHVHIRSEARVTAAV